jgi:hypothetical protein
VFNIFITWPVCMRANGLPRVPMRNLSIIAIIFFFYY